MSGETSLLRQALTDGIRYWEPRRIIYNLFLVVIVGTHALRSWTGPGLHISIDTLLVLFLLWVLANVAYCAAYLIDIPVQLSGFKQEWLKVRIVIFLIGLAFAGIVAHFFRWICWGMTSDYAMQQLSRVVTPLLMVNVKQSTPPIGRPGEVPAASGG